MNYRNIPDLMLEQYLLGELKESDRTDIERQLSEDIRLQNRLKSIRESDQLFTDIYSDNSFLRQKSLIKSIFNFSINKPQLVSVLCTFLLFPLALFLYSKIQSSKIYERAKGEISSLAAYRKTDFGHEQLFNGSTVNKLDLIQLEYWVPDSELSGMIISIDGTGNTSIHLGTDDGKSVFLSSRHMMLPFAYQLDNAPEFEKFFLVTSKLPFLLDDCIAMCKKMDKDLSVTQKFTIRMLAFSKVTQREGL